MFRVLLLCLLFPLAAQASDPAGVPRPTQLGHLAYGEADRDALAPAQGGCVLRREVAADLARMIARAAADGVELRTVSCFRSIEHQRRVFCRSSGEDCVQASSPRARSVGPPGHSEHATGYAVDFTQRAVPCPDVEPCFANTSAGIWLAHHAIEFGFEQSFPAGNAQGVTWEPWHWRWVGREGDRRPEAQRARLTFASARTRFPAAPWVGQPPRMQVAAVYRGARELPLLPVRAGQRAIGVVARAY